jgi:hypothetical protein
MTNIFVSDLLGYNIDNQTKFIVITGLEIHKFLKKIAYDDNSHNKTSNSKNTLQIIYEYNMTAIRELLKNRNINADDYLPLGDVIYKKTSEPIRLVLANRGITSYPSAYTEVKKFGNGRIMRPVSDSSEWVDVGCIFVRNGEIPNLHKIGMIESTNMISYNVTSGKTSNNVTSGKTSNNVTSGKTSNNVTSGKTAKKDSTSIAGNDFLLIQSTADTVRTVSRGEKYDKKIKLSNVANKYLTLINKSGSAALLSPMYSSQQSVQYNAQGELIIDGQCLTQGMQGTHEDTRENMQEDTQKEEAHSQNNQPVTFKSCDAMNVKQKWSLYDGKISSLNNNKCLVGSTDDETLLLDECNDLDEQSWTQESDGESTSSDFSWNDFKGRNVILVESDNPWFVNKQNAVIEKRVKHAVPTTSILKYRDNADIELSDARPSNDESMGAGSIINTTNIIEKFDGMASDGTASDNSTTYIIIVLCSIVIILLVYKFLKNKNLKF